MKAFLSHSSEDKVLVSEVARQLSRQQCVFDQYQFETGEDFRTAIRNGLDSSDVFVLFASKESLKRPWVKFELDEAEIRKIKGSLRKFLVFVIDANTDYRELPEWLQRSKVVRLLSPKPIAREIHHQLHDLVRDRQRPIFVGRSHEINEAQSALIPIDGSDPRRALLLYGLAGIGRRTLCQRIGRDIFTLPKATVLEIESGDSLLEFALKLSEEVRPFGTTEAVQTLVNELEIMSERELIARCAANLEVVVENGELPIIFDRGGLIDNDGQISQQFSALLSECDANKEIYLAMAASRRPRTENDPRLGRLACVRINPLNEDEIKRLLATIATHRAIKLTPSQISEIAEYVRGYPPAAFYALELVKTYGVDFVLINKSRLIEFRMSHFLMVLTKDPSLTGERKAILCLLSHYGPLPLRVVGIALGLNAEQLNESMSQLIDCAFVHPNQNDFYEVAAPLIDGIHRVVGGIESINHQRLASALSEYIEELSEDDQRLYVMRALFRANSLSGSGASKLSIRLTTDLVRLTEDFYHQQDYEKAIEFGRLAVERRPDNIDVRTYYVRSLVKFEEYDKAQEQIEAIRSLGALRDAYFLTGFMERRRDHIIAAIDAYENSIKRGRTGVAVHRELADCYFRVGEIGKARLHIDKAQERDPDNRYIVDLLIQIATSQRDEAAARSKLEILQTVDSLPFYYHRLSTVELAFHKTETAYEAALQAVRFSTRPTLAMLSQLIKCEIELGKHDDAGSHLAQLERNYPRIKRDIRIGLRCKWEISQRHFDNALALWSTLTEKTRPVHRALRRDAIAGYLQRPSVSIAERARFQRELDELNRELQVLDPTRLDFHIDDDR